MTDLKSRIIAAAYAIEKRFDRLRLEYKLRTGRLKPVEVIPYLGYGTPGNLYLRGRVLEGRGITRADARDPVRRNLRNTARRFLSSETPGARVRVRSGGHETVVTADEKGFFEVSFELSPPLAEPPERSLEGETRWHPVDLELLWPRARGQTEVHARGYVLVVSGARLGVISDLDDTVVKSRATDLLKMVWIILVNNAHTRLPFEGVADFYKALQDGTDGRQSNPIFYVSSSPWNLYDLFVDFLELNGLPAGPLLLKRWGLATIGRQPAHKVEAIRTLLSTYPDLPFVLIGDSGQSDLDIYRQMVREHPGRIQAVYIREVNASESQARAAEVHAIAKELRGLGVRHGSRSRLSTDEL